MMTLRKAMFTYNKETDKCQTNVFKEPRLTKFVIQDNSIKYNFLTVPQLEKAAFFTHDLESQSNVKDCLLADPQSSPSPFNNFESSSKWLEEFNEWKSELDQDFCTMFPELTLVDNPPDCESDPDFGEELLCHETMLNTTEENLEISHDPDFRVAQPAETENPKFEVSLRSKPWRVNEKPIVARTRSQSRRWSECSSSSVEYQSMNYLPRKSICRQSLLRSKVVKVLQFGKASCHRKTSSQILKERARRSYHQLKLQKLKSILGMQTSVSKIQVLTQAIQTCIDLNNAMVTIQDDWEKECALNASLLKMLNQKKKNNRKQK